MLKLEDVYDVVVAKDGQEAYDMVKESMSKNEFFDLIFMDIQVSSAHVFVALCLVLIDPDAKSGWPPKYAFDSTNGIRQSHRRFDGICRREQCSTMLRLWNGPFPQVSAHTMRITGRPLTVQQ